MAKTRTKGRYKYQKRDPKAAKERGTQQSGDFDSCWKPEATMFKCTEGDHRLRPLPPTWDNADHYGIDVWVHSSVGPDTQSYLCPEKTAGKPCCLCDAIKEAQRAGEGEAKWVGDLSPYKRVVMYVIDRDNEDEGPMLFPCPWTLDRDFSAQSHDKGSGEVLNVDDPDDGYDLLFTRQGTGMKTKYLAPSVARRTSPLHKKNRKHEAWIAQVVETPLPTLLNYYSQEHVMNVFSGAGSKGKKEKGKKEKKGKDKGKKGKGK